MSWEIQPRMEYMQDKSERLNATIKTQIKTQFGMTKTVDVGERFRQGSVLRALMSANSVDEVTSSAKDTR